MRKLLLAIALLWPTAAWAQCNGVFPPNTLCGNLTSFAQPPSAFAASSSIVGPGPTTVGNIAVWNNIGGTQLTSVPALQIYGTIGNNLFMAGPSTGGPLNPTFRAITAADITAALAAISNPTHQVFTSGSGTYTTPAGVRWIELTFVGGGGGGQGGKGNSTNGGAGGAGGATCWNTSGAACTTPVYSAGGGSGTVSTGYGNSAPGGTVTGSGTCDWSIAGGAGMPAQISTSFVTSATGQAGGVSTLGGNGSGPIFAVGVAPTANSGSGGVGGSGDSTGADSGGDGGGAGATCHVIISAPAATYTYVVGAAGTAGAAGTGGTNPRAGTAGAAGIIIVYEHYTP